MSTTQTTLDPFTVRRVVNYVQCPLIKPPARLYVLPLGRPMRSHTMPPERHLPGSYGVADMVIACWFRLIGCAGAGFTSMPGNDGWLTLWVQFTEATSVAAANPFKDMHQF